MKVMLEIAQPMKCKFGVFHLLHQFIKSTLNNFHFNDNALMTVIAQPMKCKFGVFHLVLC